MKYAFSTLLLYILCIGCASTSLPPVTQGFIFEDDEKRLWVRSGEEQKILDESGLLYQDKDLESYINEIAKKLQPPDVSEHIPFKIKTIKNHHLNAFALPNGVIYIHTGMLAKMDNEAQLAILLSHEMTHCTHRHAVKNFRSIKNKTAFLATFQVTVGSFGGGIVSLLGTLGTWAAVTGYSRELETEADMEGLKLMVNAGYDPKEAPVLFQHLKKEVEEEDMKEPFFFGTHPRLQERIENYESSIKNQYKGQSGAINADIFFKTIHEVIFENAHLDLKAGRFKIAQRGVEKYMTIKPNDVRAYYLLGEILRQRGEEGDAEKAKEYFFKAIFVDPSHPESHKGMGLLYFKGEDKALAKQYLEKYLSLSPNAFDKVYIEDYIKKCSEGGRL